MDNQILENFILLVSENKNHIIGYINQNILEEYIVNFGLSFDFKLNQDKNNILKMKFIKNLILSQNNNLNKLNFLIFFGLVIIIIFRNYMTTSILISIMCIYIILSLSIFYYSAILQHFLKNILNNNCLNFNFSKSNYHPYIHITYKIKSNPDMLTQENIIEIMNLMDDTDDFSL
jgi:hypothetical protein